MKFLSGNPYIKKEAEIIIFDQVPINEILRLSKTPIMLFLENKIRDNIKIFKKVFGDFFEKFECFYSFKANYLPEICEIIHSEGIGSEIVGLPELKLALKLGFPGNKILIGGPYLPNDLIEESIKNNVREIIVYHLDDLEKVNLIAKENNIIQDVCLRINSQKFASKLGITLDDENLHWLKNKQNSLKNINIVSMLSHYSTQMNNIELFKKNLNIIALNLNSLINIGIKIKNINLGGGFPEATVMPEKQLKEIAHVIKSSLEKFNINHEKIYFEPGRYFVGDSGLYIAEIIKFTKDRWIFLDIGNHICPKFAKCSLRFYNATKINEPHKFKTSIAGIIPTDQDVLVKDYFFNNKPTRGDHVIITNIGAYTLTFSNRFPYILPNIYLLKDKIIKQIFNPLIHHDFSIY